MLRYYTAGESHGKALAAIVDGFPAGVEIDCGRIDDELRRRQGGYGRGARQRIESDRVEILGGLSHGATMGSPIAVLIPNRDYRPEGGEEITCPRPGHGDLSGAVKYLAPIYTTSERASARETAVRTAVGALAHQLLACLGVVAFGHVVQIGSIEIGAQTGPIAQRRAVRDRSELYTLDPASDVKIKALIDQVGERGDTLGGVVEVCVEGVPFGLGSHSQWDRRLDGRLAQAVMSVQAVKGVEIGLGFAAAGRSGAEVHDPICYDPTLADGPSLGFARPTNNAGGLEAGMSNSQPIIVRAALKPICTLANPLPSVALDDKRQRLAPCPRSDVCAVPAASCVIENVVAFEIARALIDKFGGDSLAEMQARLKLFHTMAKDSFADVSAEVKGK